MQSFTNLMASLSEGEKGLWSATISDDWMQGRTTYGGLTAALCLQAVQNNNPNLPPLRSAQINFIGPAGGSIETGSKVLRRGRSVAFIEAELHAENSLATHGVFCFGEKRESRLDRMFVAKPDVANIEDSLEFFKERPGPAFTQHFDCSLAAGDPPFSGSDQGDIYVWVRHKDSAATDLAALISIADMPPPAVLPMFEEFAPISSMTWMINILSEQPQTTDGWWLMRTSAENAQNGYSSQDMTVWNSDLEAVLTARQSVAIFY